MTGPSRKLLRHPAEAAAPRWRSDEARPGECRTDLSVVHTKLPISSAAPNPSDSPQLLKVGPDDPHRRLDQFLAAALAPERSRSQVARMIRAGLVSLNGSAARASSSVGPGDRIEIIAPSAPPTPRHAPSNAPPLEVLFSDPEMLVVNKPAGITVHPAPGHPHSTLVDALMAAFPDLAAMVDPDGPMRPGIVHRLDRNTSGVMVVARTAFSRMALSQQFKDRTVYKTYLALVRGIVSRDRFTVARPVGRHPTERKRMSVHSHNPRAAITQFLVLHRFNGSSNPATLLRARPETGRTHQIRVHLAAAGHPCLGDTVYGDGANAASSALLPPGRQALHALALALTHPRTAQRREFIAPIPDDLLTLITASGLEVGPMTIQQWLAAE
jgi:23S rRNA pseudouridine1911/1915/1917 synthase